MAESNRQRRLFPDAFKLEAVAAVRGGRSVSAVAAELGLPDRLVRAWPRRDTGRPGGGWAGVGGGGKGAAGGGGGARRPLPPGSRWRRRAGWARARPIRPPRSDG